VTPRSLTLLHQAEVTDLFFSPDGKTIMTRCGDGIVRRWDVITGQPLGTAIREKATHVAFSPDAKIVLTAKDRTARLWNAATGQTLGTPMEHQSSVRAVSFSPDGKTILTGCFDKAARLWSVPPLVEGDVDRVRHWIQALTDLELDPQGDFHVLDTETWQQRRDRLEQLGRPPRP
jgi:WD40 repeat protein